MGKPALARPWREPKRSQRLRCNERSRRAVPGAWRRRVMVGACHAVRRACPSSSQCQLISAPSRPCARALLPWLAAQSVECRALLPWPCSLWQLTTARGQHPPDAPMPRRGAPRADTGRGTPMPQHLTPHAAARPRTVCARTDIGGAARLGAPRVLLNPARPSPPTAGRALGSARKAVPPRRHGDADNW